MPPRGVTRVVSLRRPPAAPSTAKMNLLTYRMALAQPEATLPLLAQRPSGSISEVHKNRAADGALILADQLSSAHQLRRGGGRPASPAGLTGDSKEEALAPRRWVRDADELCVSSIHRSNNINRINSYVAAYKLEDPQWAPLLLPEVFVLPSAAPPSEGNQRKEGGDGPPPPSSASSRQPGHDVYIDYNKLTSLELMSRHANYALRHLVQKGHAMYFITYAQHSVLQMRGLVEASYVSCAYGVRGERLRTHLTHVGPLDVRDVIEVDPVTHRVSFNFKKPNIRRGVVAVSTVEGYGTWFQRKPMLWQRTRRVGALQSQMGAFEFDLASPASVGKIRDYEVALLEPHLRVMGLQGGAEGVGIVASPQVALNEKLYMGEFEAPVVAALDAVHQLTHHTALHHQLVHPAPPSLPEEPNSHHHKEMEELRRLASMEKILPVSWVTRTPPPYIPLEGDLPFKLQLSKPSVFHPPRPRRGRSPSEEGPVVYPTGGTVGSPFVEGVPLSLYEYIIHQGVDHYIFDDAPSSRPMKWWNQKSNMPYNGYMYTMRSGLLDAVRPREEMTNPLAPSSSASSSSRRAARWKRRTAARRRLQKKQALHRPPEEQEERNGEAWSPPAEHLTTDDGGDLQGHGEEDRRVTMAQQEEEAQEGERPPLCEVVPPNARAQERLRRYTSQSASSTAPGEDAAPAQKSTAKRRKKKEGGRGGPEALLRRQLALRRLRAAHREKKE